MPPDETAPVLVFDLDGTILDCNSFPRWVLFLIAGRVAGLGAGPRMRLASRAARLLLSRLLARFVGGQDHGAFMRGLGDAWSAAGAGVKSDRLTMAEGFHRRLERHVRPCPRALLDRVAAGEADAILATAASDDYALTFARRLGFSHAVATPARGGMLNAGIRKRDAVMAMLTEHGWSGRDLVLLTDHIDDLPLMRESRLVVWFGPARLMARACEAAGDVAFVDLAELDGETLVRLACEQTPVRSLSAAL